MTAGVRLLPTILGAWLALGCAGSLEAAARSPSGFRADAVSVAEPSPHCQGLDRDRVTWGAVAAGAAILGGSGGIAVIPIDSEGGRMALGITSAVAATVGAVALGMQTGATEAWARDCARPSGGKP